MKDAAPKSSQRAPSRMPTRRDIDTFRICTTQDFDSPQTPKRKPGPYTLACEMCRTRKIKCLASDIQREATGDAAGGRGSFSRNDKLSGVSSRVPRPRPSCQACIEANIACHWEVEDGRKRQRRRASSRAGQQIQGSSPQAGAGAGPAEAKTPAPLHDEQEAAAEKRAPPPATSAPQNGNRISQQSFSDDPPPCLPSVTAAAATAAEEFPKAVFLPRSGSVHQPPGLASIFETQVGSHELISTEPFIAEFYPYDTTTIQAAELQDWPDMQNFVLDFSGIGEGGAEGAFPSSSQINDATTTTHQASYHASYHAATTAVPSPRSPLVDLSGISGISGHNVQQPPNRPRLIRIRYYRRFGPTAIVPGLRKLSVVVNPQQEEEDSQTPEVSSVRMADSYEPETAVGSSDAAAASANFPTRNISHGSSPGGSVGSSYGSRKHLFFDSGAPGIPRADVISPILDIFFAHFGGHFPFHHPHILGGHVRSGEASSFLLNAIAALTLRFCSQEQEGVATAGSPLIAILQAQFPESAQVWQRGQVYLKKAKEQLVPLLSIPAPEVVAGLVILAWAEFGDNNEAGLWMFTGMAIRMAQDLGFHRLPDTAADLSSDVFDVFHDQARPTLDGRVVLTDEQSAVHQQKARLVMFWSVLFLDVCVSLGTGRLPSIRPSEVEVAVPTYADMKLAQLDFSEPVTLGNMIFPTTARFMLLFSEAVEALNERGWAGSGSVSNSGVGNRFDDKNNHDDRREERLERIQEMILQRYRALPAELTFSIDNYREAAATRQAGLFLMLHLFFYTFMILLSEKTATRSRLHREDRQTAIGVQEPMDIDARPRPGIGIASACCQKAVQAVTIARLVDPNGVIGTPFISHCLFVVASTIQQECSPVASLLLTSTDFGFLCQTLREQGRYFPAINSIISVLEQREKQRQDDGIDGDIADTTPRNILTRCLEEHPEAAVEERVVGVYDPGIVHRYAIPE